MNYQLKRNKSGFTIIEVMIVLAIAGLIMAIIFLAVPALQRNSHNNSRRSDASHLAGLVNEYAANHSGVLPTAMCSTGTTCPSTSLDIRNENWALIAAPSTVNVSATPNYGSVTTAVLNNTHTCNLNAMTQQPGSRSFSIGFTVETSGGTQTSCLQGLRPDLKQIKERHYKPLFLYGSMLALV